jgi:hypothetical protein
MINKDLLKNVWRKIDDIVDWVKITGKTMLGTILELADNILGPASLDYLNEKLVVKLPQEIIDNLEVALQAFIDDDFEKLQEALVSVPDELIDIKQLPDDIEAAWIASNLNALVAFIKFYSAKKGK